MTASCFNRTAHLLTERVSRDTVELLRAQTPDFIPPDLWPPNSPDLNPVDYSIWSVMQEKVYQTHIANIDELKHRLVQVWAELDQRHIAGAIGRWRRRPTPDYGLGTVGKCLGPTTSKGPTKDGCKIC